MTTLIVAIRKDAGVLAPEDEERLLKAIRLQARAVGCRVLGEGELSVKAIGNDLLISLAESQKPKSTKSRA